MINFIWWASTTFLTLGLVEAVVKPLAKQWVQRRLLAAAPRVLKQIDRALPQLILNTDSPEQLEAHIRHLFETATGEDWSKESLEPFFQMYDLRKALVNYQQRET